MTNRMERTINEQKNRFFELSNGVHLPAVGFGTFRATQSQGPNAILMALEAGYRCFDTASFYDNEAEIAQSLRKSGIARKDLFLTSKAWRTQLGYEEVKCAFAQSLENLQTDYLDLYLIHWPKQDPQDTKWGQRVRDTWRAMEELYEERKIRAIGVSNFLPHHLAELAKSARIAPMVDQLELHVGYLQTAAVAYCRAEGIVPQAWSPLGRQRMMSHPVLLFLAEKYGVSVAQLLLRFLNQNDIAVVPKASSRERIQENMDLFGFTIGWEDLSLLQSLPQCGWSGEHPDLPRVPAQNE